MTRSAATTATTAAIATYTIANPIVRLRERRPAMLAGSWLRIAVASPVAPPDRALSYVSTSSRSRTSWSIVWYRVSRSLAVARSSTAASAADTSGRAPLYVWEALAHVLHRDAHVAVPAEGHLPDEGLVHHDAECVEVAAAVDELMTHRLLGAHVVRRAPSRDQWR